MSWTETHQQTGWAERYRVAAIVPCHNEEAAVATVVADLRAAVPGITVYVYDCEQNQGLPGRGLTLAYDWPRCLGVDLSAPARWRSTHPPAGREGGDRIGA